MPDPVPTNPSGAPAAAPGAPAPLPIAGAAPVAAAKPIDPAAAMTARLVALGFDSVEELIAALEEPDDPTNPTPQAQETVMPDPVTPPGAAGVTPATAATPAATPSPAAVVAAAQPGVAAPVVPGQPSNDPPEDRSLPENVRRKLRQARDEYRQKTAAAEAAATAANTKVTTYEQQIAQMRAEEGLKLDLVRAGMHDLDFGWHALKQHLAALGADKTPEGVEKLKTFDAKIWAAEQRKTRPYLFGEQPIAANTGAPTGAAPPVPGAGPVAAGVGQAGAFNARTASPAEYKKRMAELGISTNGMTSPPLRGN